MFFVPTRFGHEFKLKKPGFTANFIFLEFP